MTNYTSNKTASPKGVKFATGPSSNGSNEIIEIVPKMTQQEQVQFKSELIEDHFTLISTSKEREKEARLSAGQLRKSDTKGKKSNTYKGITVEPATFSTKNKHASTELQDKHRS